MEPVAMERLTEASSDGWEQVGQVWEPDPEGPQARLHEELEATMREAQEHGCKVQFLKKGCRTLMQAKSQEFRKLAETHDERRCTRNVLELWRLVLRASRLRRHRLRRAWESWQLMRAENVKLTVMLEDCKEQQVTLQSELKRFKATAAGLLSASALVAAVLFVLREVMKSLGTPRLLPPPGRHWTKKLTQSQLELQGELERKETRCMTELDQTEQRLLKSN
ncbi:unnamed protein product, partial [Durusdinium trenchii]